MPLHPDIRFALSCFPKSQRAAVQTVLTDLGVAPEGRKSSLTGDGFPFELSFTTADNDLRWTCELAGNATATDRLKQTCRTFARLGGIANAIGTTPHRFGAWLGGRQTCDGQAKFKLYLDPGVGNPPCGAPLIGGDVAGFRPVLRMIGLGPDAGRREYYYRFQSASPHLLRQLAETAGLGNRSRDLLDILHETSGQAAGELLIRSSLGVSFAYTQDRDTAQMTLYLFARAVWGSDSAIRDRFLRLLTTAGRDTSAYAAATAPLRDHRRNCTWHGMVALILTDTHHGWGIGLRPVQHPAAIPYQRISACPTPLPC